MPAPPSLAAELDRDEAAIASAATAVDGARAGPAGAAAIDQLRHELRLGHAEFGYREAVRAEQQAITTLAAGTGLEAATVPLLRSPHLAGLGEATAALRALWRLAGIGDPGGPPVRRSRAFDDAEPVDVLRGYYASAAAGAGIDWSYLAAINYIESDFGRVDGPSSAGALGPMQFLPSTWRQFGGGGDVMSARDSIRAAALFLSRMGAPGDYGQAILHYNRDADYVASVEHFAAALRADPLWLVRLYYWSTFG